MPYELGEYGIPTWPGYTGPKKKSKREQLENEKGPYNIIEYEEAGEYNPPVPRLRKFSSAAARNSYLHAKKAREEQELAERRRQYQLFLDKQARSAQTARARSASRSATLRRRETSASRSAALSARHAANREAARKAAENEETARMNCIGRTCRRVKQYLSGTHNLSGTRKKKMNGGRR
jgi:hypothetical protein